MTGKAGANAYGWTKIPMMLPGTGVTKDDRIGDKIFIRYVKVNIEISKISNDSVLTAPYLRILVLKDRVNEVDTT